MSRSIGRLTLAGGRFGRLSVNSVSHKNKRGEIYWNCRCDCGNNKIVRANALTSGNTLSCGCYHRERVSDHGMTGKPTFKSWTSMKQRCLNPNSPAYRNYGGCGILICERWANSFDNFLKDMGQRPHWASLDRIDVNGNYEPGNCRWSAARQQQRNRRDTPQLTFRDIRKSWMDWSEETGIPTKVIGWRLYHGWDVERTLTTPVRPKCK